MNVCPVCGYLLPYPPSDFHICPSCGTEFGYDDSGASYDELRAQWLATGPSWWSPVDPQPDNWNPYMQLIKGVSLNPAQAFAVPQGSVIQGSNFLTMGRTHHIAVRRKRAASQGRVVVRGLPDFRGSIVSGRTG